MNYLYYVHDPMCSWCYAFKKTLANISNNLPKNLILSKIIGGLAPDSTSPMPKALIKNIQNTWHKIEATVPDIHFNHLFWDNNKPLRSTYPACRAVLAAKNQSPSLEHKMIHQIQWAYYINAENPSLNETLISCAEKIGLTPALFANALQSQVIEDQLQDNIKFARSIGVSSYPSLVLRIDTTFIPIAINYINEQTTLDQINHHLKSNGP